MSNPQQTPNSYTRLFTTEVLRETCGGALRFDFYMGPGGVVSDAHSGDGRGVLLRWVRLGASLSRQT